VVNLGTGTRISINELWQRAVKACGQQPSTWPVRRTLGRPGDQRHMQADISRVQDALGWNPKISLDEGIARTAAWARTDEGAQPTSPGAGSSENAQPTLTTVSTSTAAT